MILNDDDETLPSNYKDIKMPEHGDVCPDLGYQVIRPALQIREKLKLFVEA